MQVTVVTLYHGKTGEIYTQVIEGELDDSQKSLLRMRFSCDEYHKGNEDEKNNMFFRTINTIGTNKLATFEMLNVDGTEYP